MSSEHRWWNCGRLVFVADTAHDRVDKRRVRSPGRALCEYGMNTLRIGMNGEIFDGRTGPGPNVFETMAEAAEYMADHYARKRELDQAEHWRSFYKIKERDWRGVAKQSRATLRAKEKRG